MQNTKPDEPPKHTDDPATKTSQGTTGNANNQWRLPPVNTEAPTTTNALSVLLSAMSSKAQADAAAHTSIGTGDSENGQQDAWSQASDSSGEQSGSKDSSGAEQEVDNHAQSDDPSGSEVSEGAAHEAGSQNGNSQQFGHDSSNGGSNPGGNVHSDDLSLANDPGTPANGGQPAVTWNHEGQAFTAISSNGAIIAQGNGAKSTLAIGATATFEGQVIEVPSVGNAVVIDEAAASLVSPAGSGNKQGNRNGSPTATFTEAGQSFTVTVQGNSLVLEAAGSTTTMAYGAQGTFAGQSVSMPSSPGTNVININGKSFTLQSNNADQGKDGKGPSHQTQLAAVITQNGKTFTAIVQGSSTLILEASSTTLTIPPGAAVTLDGEIFRLPTTGDILVHDGITLTLTPTALSTAASYTAAATGQPLSAFDVGSSIVIVAGGNTITLADGARTVIGGESISAASTGGAAVVVNGGKTSTLIASSTNTMDSSSASVDGDGEAAAETSNGLDAESAASSINRGSLAAWMTFVLVFAIGSCVDVI